MRRTCVLVALLIGFSGGTALAQQTNGDAGPVSDEEIIVFVQAADLPPLDSGIGVDVLVFTGGSTFQLSSFSGCNTPGPDLFLQNAVLVDRNGVRSGRHVSVI